MVEDQTAQKHLATDHLRGDLRRRTISSGVITTAAQGIQFVVNFGSIMVLARLLTPQDFGLVAMVATVMGFLRIFNEAGLSTATIQREDITHAQVSNLFWVNVAVGAVITLLLAALSPAVAAFFREPRLVAITASLSISFLITSSSVQHRAILKRQMRFKAIAAIDVLSAVAGVVVGIVLAWLGYGYWSLVWMQLVTSSVTLVGAWTLSHWRPQRPKRMSGTKSLLHFGANLTASSFLWSLARGSDNILVGRFFGADPLGVFSRANQLLARPLQQLIGPIESVFVPMLSRLQNEPERYRRVVLQAFQAIAAGSFFFAGLLLATSEPMVLVVLGAKWAEAIPIFAAFTPLAVLMPVASVATWLLTSQGRGSEFLLLSTIGSLATIVAFAAGLPFGPTGVAAAYSISCFVVILPLQYHIAGRSGPVSARDLWAGFFRHLPVWVVVTGATYGTTLLVRHLPALPQLLISLTVGVVIGCAFVWAYRPSRTVVQGVIQILRERRALSAPK